MPWAAPRKAERAVRRQETRVSRRGQEACAWDVHGLCMRCAWPEKGRATTDRMNTIVKPRRVGFQPTIQAREWWGETPPYACCACRGQAGAGRNALGRPAKGGEGGAGAGDTGLPPCARRMHAWHTLGIRFAHDKHTPHRAVVWSFVGSGDRMMRRVGFQPTICAGNGGVKPHPTLADSQSAWES